jgi:hypothetical protein
MSVKRDVAVKIRFSIIETELLDENNPSGRGGRRGPGQKRWEMDVPEFVTDSVEMARRLSDAASVLFDGYELDNDAPPTALTHEATLVTKTTALLNGYIYAEAATACGFMVALTKEVDTDTHVADQSPVAQNTSAAISHALAGLTPNTRYYYRAYATIAGIDTRYGRVRSFKTLAV